MIEFRLQNTLNFDKIDNVQGNTEYFFMTAAVLSHYRPGNLMIHLDFYTANDFERQSKNDVSSRLIDSLSGTRLWGKYIWKRLLVFSDVLNIKHFLGIEIQ